MYSGCLDLRSSSGPPGAGGDEEWAGPVLTHLGAMGLCSDDGGDAGVF